jgi:long-subunit acyl-CoA synthetase (AMP-forming)
MPLAPPTDYESWDAILGRTEPLAGNPQRDADEMATIVYTSGSTGVPKGVMQSFGSMSLVVSQVVELVDVNSDDRMLSYLPLAHVVERVLIEQLSLYYGFRIFFAESLDTFVNDLNRARPTVFVSVPRLWLKFQLGIYKKLPKKKLALLLKIPLIRGLIRKKVLSGLGLDACRFAISGSAPIPAELIQWYRSLGLELLEAYGMSENFGWSHGNKPGDVLVGSVGTVQPGVECRLSDAGEILVKSPGMMMGYYKAPELTAEAFTEDGFLKTGDRGEVLPSGHLRITGRIKELFKTSKGKYVAPAPIENKLLVHDKIEMACVSGSGHPSPFAMVVLSEEARAAGASARPAIAKELDAHRESINAVLDKHERLGLVVVIADEWTIDNGKLTPTMKLKRNAIEDELEPLYDGWYSSGETVVWHD